MKSYVLYCSDALKNFDTLNTLKTFDALNSLRHHQVPCASVTLQIVKDSNRRKNGYSKCGKNSIATIIFGLLFEEVIIHIE